jgi:hypothetical protein
MVVLAGVCTMLPANLQAQPPNDSPSTAAVTGRAFATPDEAVKTLQAAVEAKDKAALIGIFGREAKELLTGDAVQDADNAKKFAAVMAQGYTLVKAGDDTITVEVGTDAWPMPIPLVKANGQWYFNTAAGKEEIINRHIGKDELHAIGVCRAYVTAQQNYAKMNTDAGGRAVYAMKFKSTPGARDGLYWATTGNEPASPFGPLVAEAHAEGFSGNKSKGPRPFHGYYFRILTRQGAAAPGGKMNYLDNGTLTGGFALVAYPAYWDHSGIMTFIVNQDGRVLQQNLGEKSTRIGALMKEYNPDGEWTLVKDDGVVQAVLER